MMHADGRWTFSEMLLNLLYPFVTCRPNITREAASNLGTSPSCEFLTVKILASFALKSVWTLSRDVAARVRRHAKPAPNSPC